MNDDKNKAGVPEGWKLVPVEPTREILHAMAVMSNDGFRAAYAAMLAAAPQPPAAEVGELSSIDTPEFRAMVSEFINAPALFGQSAAKAAWGRIVDYITVWGSAQPALAAPQPPAAESRAQAAGGERDALIAAAISVLKQDYSADCLKMASTREYVEDAVGQLIDAGFRAALAATPSEGVGAGVPEGFTLVPKIATQAISQVLYYHPGRQMVTVIWKELLAAAQPTKDE